MVYLLFCQQEVILPHSNKFVKILEYFLTAITASCIDMSDVHHDFMRGWARNNGKTAQQRTVTQEPTKYESGTLPLNMYQTEEKIGEQLPFDGASEEREKQLKVTSIAMKVVLTLTVIWVMMSSQDKTCRFWEPPAQDAWRITVFICSGSGWNAIHVSRDWGRSRNEWK